jgi:hypothetical protein
MFASDNAFERIREAVVVGIIALLIGAAVYTILGFAWTFKTAVETSQKLRHPFAGRSEGRFS